MNVSRRLLAVTFAVVAASSARAAALEMPAFTADQEITAGEAKTTSKVYSSGKRMRLEQNLQGNKMTSIADYTQQKMWVLMPPPVGCIEQKVPFDPKDPSAASGPGYEEEKLGAETIDGHPTEKYKVTTVIDGKTYVTYQWRATDLKGLPVKVTDDANSYEAVYKNVVLGNPDPKLFEVPKDCKSFGNLMQGMGAPPTNQ